MRTWIRVRNEVLILNIKRNEFKAFSKKITKIGTSSIPLKAFVTLDKSILKKNIGFTLKRLSNKPLDSFTFSYEVPYQFGKISQYVLDLSRILPHCMNLIRVYKFIYSRKDIKKFLHN